MNGERYPGESLPFEPSMRHADGRLIAIIERTTYSCMIGRTKPKCSIFSMQARLEPRLQDRGRIPAGTATCNLNCTFGGPPTPISARLRTMRLRCCSARIAAQGASGRQTANGP